MKDGGDTSEVLEATDEGRNRWESAKIGGPEVGETFPEVDPMDFQGFLTNSKSGSPI